MMIRSLQWLAALLLAICSGPAFSVPLSTVPAFCTSNPDQCNIGNQSLTVVRGIGTNAYYVLEADPATGEIPVSLSGAGITIDYSGTPGDPVPGSAAYVAGIDGNGDLQGIKVDTAGELQVDVLSSTLPAGAATAARQDTGNASLASIDGKIANNYGAATGAVRTASQLGNASGIADFNLGTPTAQTLRSACMLGVGSAAVANGNPVPISDAGSSITVDGTVAATQSGTWTVAVSNLPATQDTNYGTPGSSTPRAAAMLGVGSTAVSTSNPVPNNMIGKPYADSVYNNYASTGVTTGAWVQMIASTAAVINALYITDTCGQVLELGTGAAASETRKLLIPRGGMAEPVWLAIPSGTRISLRAISGNCSTGDFVLTGLN